MAEGKRRTRRWVLLGGGAAIAAGFAIREYRLIPQAYAGGQIAAATAHQQALDGAIHLIDIRTPREWRATGVAEGAHPLDMRREDFVQALDHLLGRGPICTCRTDLCTRGALGPIEQSTDRGWIYQYHRRARGYAGFGGWAGLGAGWVACSTLMKRKRDECQTLVGRVLCFCRATRPCGLWRYRGDVRNRIRRISHRTAESGEPSAGCVPARLWRQRPPVRSRTASMVEPLLARGYAVMAPEGSERNGRKSWNFFPGWEGRDETAFLTEVVQDAADRFGYRPGSRGAGRLLGWGVHGLLPRLRCAGFIFCLCPGFRRVLAAASRKL